MDELVLREEVFAIVGAAIEVQRELGAGFLEAVYQEAMERELALRGITFGAQRELVIHYKGQPLGKGYICDLVCFGNVLVELKSNLRRWIGLQGARKPRLLTTSSHPAYRLAYSSISAPTASWNGDA